MVMSSTIVIFPYVNRNFTGIHREVYLLSDAPNVTVSPEVKTVVKGRNLNLTCAASGKPKPSIKWTKVGSSDFLSNASQLTVENVTRPRAANSKIQYQCMVRNGVEAPATATASIIVNCKYLGTIAIHCASLFDIECFSPFLISPQFDLFSESYLSLFFLLHFGNGFSSVLEIIYDPLKIIKAT